ncbi:MAG TPA: YceH family protein [Bryobacteraceae bacterium]|nr:YceH family protein [Bryobacteraceae bacterium]
MDAQLQPPLDPVEVRVLGALIEKEITTPEYYPLSVNALTNACNQKNNRDPVVSYSDEDVREALERLRERGLAFVRTGAGSRVEKFGQRLQEQFNFGRREIAALDVLMLRGPSTLGEIRTSGARMHPFDDLEEVERTLQGLSDWQGQPFVVQLPRAPGTKEPRWAHLLSGQPAASPERPAEAAAPRQDRLTALEIEVARLRFDLDTLLAEFAALKRQLD